MLWPVKIRNLQVRCLHTYFKSGLFNIPKACIGAQEGNKMTVGQKKAWQSQEEPSPKKAGKERDQADYKLLFFFLTIQCHFENTSIFKDYFIEDTR